MNISGKLLWNLYAGIIGSVTTLVTAKAIDAAWELATGDTPPKPNDPEVPLRRAITWAVASGLGVSIAQLLINRFAAHQWQKLTGSPAPGFRTPERN